MYEQKATNFTVQVNPDYCKECGFCFEVCKSNVFEQAKYLFVTGFRPTIVTNGQNCSLCYRCVQVCPDFAIEIVTVNAAP
jgi:NAD-dependent dihydropyrimidine dehydrogenase PreA subunit